MSTDKKMLWNYAHIRNYNNDDQNAIGVTNSTTLRTLDTVSGDTAYVRKFGVLYGINFVTGIEDPVDVNMTFTVRAMNGTILGSRTGGGAFNVGSGCPPDGCYLEISASGGAVTVLASITIDTNIDGAGLAFACPAESVADGGILTLHLSDTGSTYYDSEMMYGGARHTPVLDNNRKPYFAIGTAYAALNSANDGVEVVDSCTYDEELTFDRATTFVQASLGHTPKITSGFGARITREVTTQYNNTTAIYFSKAGDDANSGTWQEPKLTIANAITNRAGKNVIYGGSGCLGNEVFEESASIVGYTFEPDYGYICTITKPSWSLIGVGDNTTVSGIITKGGSIGFSCTYVSPEIKDCTSCNNSMGIRLHGTDFTGVNIQRCLLYNNTQYGIDMQAQTFDGTIQDCICYNNYRGIVSIVNGTFSGILQNCICYDNNTGIEVMANIDFSGTIQNCVCYNNATGIRSYFVTSVTGVIQNCIFYGNQTDLYNYAGASGTLTDSAYSINSGFTIGAGCITADPKFCRVLTTPYKLGISADSPCYHTDSTYQDMGTHSRTIIIGESDIIINGFTIDGQSRYNNAISILDTDNDIGLNVKWCTIDNYQGITIDLYDNNTDTDAIIKNCIIRNGGNGIKFVRGGNTVEECLIYNNVVFGVHADYAAYTFNHNVFYNNQYGIYFEYYASGIVVKNSIFCLNGLYGICSEVLTWIAHCCIIDAVSNVTISDESNIADDPLFVNVNTGEENLHIKTMELEYFFNSPCKNTADDGKDIGAYDVARSTAENYWEKYILDFNPQVTWGNNLKGYTVFIDTEGNSDNYAKDSKRIFTLDFGKRKQVSSERLRQKMEYFATLIKMRKNDLTEDNTIFRMHLAPATFLLSGNSTIDASAKTLTHAQTINENKFKGFHVGIKFTSGSGTGSITAATKKLQVTPSPVWTDDEHIGYYVFHNGYYYYILNNDADELTLSDPLGTLENEVNIDWAIEKYFKIEKHTNKGVFTLKDTNNELINGNYAYYINFIEVKVFTPKFGYSQPIFDYKREHSKSGFKIVVEEA